MQIEFIVILVFFAILVIGVWFWMSRRTTKPSDETPATEISITASERLEQFKKDLFKAYDSIEAKKHYSKYIPLDVVKKELSSKYTLEQFNDLLGQARRKYPNKIWIDRDKGQQVFIKILQ